MTKKIYLILFLLPALASSGGDMSLPEDDLTRDQRRHLNHLRMVEKHDEANEKETKWLRELNERKAEQHARAEEELKKEGERLKRQQEEELNRHKALQKQMTAIKRRQEIEGNVFFDTDEEDGATGVSKSNPFAALTEAPEASASSGQSKSAKRRERQKRRKAAAAAALQRAGTSTSDEGELEDRGYGRGRGRGRGRGLDGQKRRVQNAQHAPGRGRGRGRGRGKNREQKEQRAWDSPRSRPPATYADAIPTAFRKPTHRKSKSSAGPARQQDERREITKTEDFPRIPGSREPRW